MIMFEHTDVTSRDIVRLKKYELVDLVISLVAGADVTVEKHSYGVEPEDRRSILVLSGDDVFDYLEGTVETSEYKRNKHEE